MGKGTSMKVVGKDMARADALEKIRGEARYVDDIKIEGMLYGGVVRSREPHLLVRGVRIKGAERLRGYMGMVVARDIPGENIIPLVLGDWPFLAGDRAKFQGDPVALVAAERREVAQEAVERAEVMGSPLKGVFSPLEAMEKGSVKVYGEDNIFKSFVIEKGDVEEGFRHSDLAVEAEFETGHQVHSYMETQGMIAIPEPDGGITILGSMQCPFYVRDAVSAILAIPLSRVRVIQLTTGGGFGGKEDVPSQVAGQAALLAWKFRRPVKLIYSREEDFLSMSKRHPSVTRVKYGATKEGKLLSCQVKYIIDAGAYATLSPIVLWRGTVHSMGPYEIPHVKVESYAVATNKVPCGAFRGFGQPQVAFAQESVMDILAYKLGISPLRLRLMNRLDKGKLTGTGQEILESCAMRGVIEEAAKESRFHEKWKPEGRREGHRARGIGISSTFYGVGLGAGGMHLERAGAGVQVERDGSVSVFVGNTEMGQGALTVLGQITAETLGCRPDRVKVQAIDTAAVPDSGPTVASRTTVMSGNAIIDACRGIVERMKGVASELLNLPPGRALWADSDPPEGQGLSYIEVVRECHRRREQMTGSGWVKVEGTTFDQKGLGSPYMVYTFSANIAEVEVDLETGEVRVTDFYSAHDVGRAINPLLLKGQIEGGVMKGVGYTLMEELLYREGRMLNPDFLDYTIPTSLDMVRIHPIVLEDPFDFGPYGAKGIGEPPFIGVAPAIANAIYNAIGIRFHRLPVKPEEILKKIEGKER